MSGDGKYSVHHFVDIERGVLEGEYGNLEIEEMHYEVKQELADLNEGDTTADPEAVADKWRDRVSGLLEACHGRSVEEVERAMKMMDNLRNGPGEQIERLCRSDREESPDE